MQGITLNVKKNNNLCKERLATTAFLASFLPSVLMNAWRVLGFTLKVIQNQNDSRTVLCFVCPFKKTDFDHKTVTFETPRPPICGTDSNKL